MYHLRQHALFSEQPEERLRAMAFAFLAQGGTNDYDHGCGRSGLHKIHYKANRPASGAWHLKMHEQYMDLVMDVVSTLSFYPVCSLTQI